MSGKKPKQQRLRKSYKQNGRSVKQSSFLNGMIQKVSEYSPEFDYYLEPDTQDTEYSEDNTSQLSDEELNQLLQQYLAQNYYQ